MLNQLGSDPGNSSCQASHFSKSPAPPGCNTNPINPGTGNKYQNETDYASSLVDGLGLTRTYNGSPFSVDARVTRSFGARWTQPFDAILRQETPQQNGLKGTCWRWTDDNTIWCESPISPTPGVIPDAVSIVRGDGKRYLFNRSGTGYFSQANVNDRLTATFNAANTAVTGWAYVAANGDVTESYDANGRLISITSRSGAVQQLTYSDGTTNDTSVSRVPSTAPVCTHVQAGAVLPAGLLLCVTDNWGRQLNFEYDITGRITKMIDPANQTTTYAYDGLSGGCPTPDATNLACSANNLTQVTYPDGHSKTYYYNEAAQINGGSACAGMAVVGNGFSGLLNSLTGIVDENGNRYATWAYDCLGRATSSQHAGGVDMVNLAYGTPDGSGNSTTSVTQIVGPPGNSQTVVNNLAYTQILGVSKNTSIDQPCIGCGPVKSRSYDGNGNVSSTTDWNGNVTNYQYDLSRNVEISRVEAAGTPLARTITTQWHPTYHLPAKIAEPLRITTFNYDANGNLMSKAVLATTDANGSQSFNAQPVGAARIWSYTYNGVGQVQTVTDPNLNTATYSYDAQGNLINIKNAANQLTQLTNYDANGRVGRVIDSNGLIIDLSYSPRGWLTNKAVSGAGITQITSYGYDYVGQLTSVSLPDGSSINYVYDPAHRLTKISDSLGNSINYTLDLTGNSTADRVNDPSGNLTRQITRVYDALNHVQQVTGGAQ